VRDASLNGRVVDAVSPTMYSTAPATVGLRVAAGDTVKKGQVLAVQKGCRRRRDRARVGAAHAVALRERRQVGIIAKIDFQKARDALQACCWPTNRPATSTPRRRAA
jgi:hypothetical protein